MQNQKFSASQFLELPLSEIHESSATDFDFYIRSEGSPALYAPGPHWWSAEELRKLRLAGHASLLYRKSDSERVKTWLKIQAISWTAVPEKRIPRLNDAAAELTRILYEQEMSHAIVAKGQTIAVDLVRCIKEDPRSVAAIGKLARHDDYTYYHSARVAAYSLAIAVTMSQSSDPLLEQLALGCLFHDVGKSKIALSVLNKPGTLTPPEWDLMRRHPGFGIEIIELSTKARFTTLAREIVVHHHEKMDGSGYPHGLGASEISTEVRIAAFADVFDALTTPRPYQSSRSRYEAFDYIRHTMMKTLDVDVYKAVVELFKGA